MANPPPPQTRPLNFDDENSTVPPLAPDATENLIFPMIIGRRIPPTRSTAIVGESAIHLYQSLQSGYSISNNDEDSFHSVNEFGQTCRICRYVNNDIELIQCPCKCTGSVGFVHLKCLQRWIRFRRDNHCEICKEIYNLPVEKRDYSVLFSSLFRAKYLGSIMKNIVKLVAVTPLVYFTMNQLVFAMERINDSPTTFKLLIVGPCMLLGTSLYFFLYFEWALSCLFRIRNILAHWWTFGDQLDDDYDPDLSFDSFSAFFELD